MENLINTHAVTELIVSLPYGEKTSATPNFPKNQEICNLNKAKPRKGDFIFTLMRKSTNGHAKDPYVTVGNIPQTNTYIRETLYQWLEHMDAFRANRIGMDFFENLNNLGKPGSAIQSGLMAYFDKHTNKYMTSLPKVPYVKEQTYKKMIDGMKSVGYNMEYFHYIMALRYCLKCKRENIPLYVDGKIADIDKRKKIYDAVDKLTTEPIRALLDPELLAGSLFYSGVCLSHAEILGKKDMGLIFTALRTADFSYRPVEIGLKLGDLLYAYILTIKCGAPVVVVKANFEQTKWPYFGRLVGFDERTCEEIENKGTPEEQCLWFWYFVMKDIMKIPNISNYKFNEFINNLHGIMISNHVSLKGDIVRALRTYVDKGIENHRRKLSDTDRATFDMKTLNKQHNVVFNEYMTANGVVLEPIKTHGAMEDEIIDNTPKEPIPNKQESIGSKNESTRKSKKKRKKVEESDKNPFDQTNQSGGNKEEVIIINESNTNPFENNSEIKTSAFVGNETLYTEVNEFTSDGSTPPTIDGKKLSEEAMKTLTFLLDTLITVTPLNFGKPIARVITEENETYPMVEIDRNLGIIPMKNGQFVQILDADIFFGGNLFTDTPIRLE